MRYLCLIYFDEQSLADMPPAERNALNAAHLDFNDDLRRTGHYLMAEALDPPRAPLATIEVRPACQLVVEGREPRWG